MLPALAVELPPSEVEEVELPPSEAGGEVRVELSLSVVEAGVGVELPPSEAGADGEIELAQSEVGSSRRVEAFAV